MSDSAWLSGKTIGRYRVGPLLGRGGMGEVYRAEDVELRRQVALKVLPEALVGDADRLARFIQEARTASALNHPHLVSIYEIGAAAPAGSGQPVHFIAMELVQGETLRELLDARRLDLKRTLDYLGQAADALAAAHAAGIVHRDLKPDNVMVRADGLAKIVDFGLAKLNPAIASAAAGDAAPTLTQTAMSDPGVVMGTVGYMSPEQASGHPVDYRSDQFALGLLIYEMVTRTRPFERSTTAQTLAATIEAEAPPIESISRDVPPHLAAMVRRLLAKKPEDRYESTRDLARELKGILEPSSAPAAGSRRLILSVVAIAAIVIAGAALALWFWRQAGTAPPADAERPLLAVRPFRSLSTDPQQGFFAAGMTEEIRGQLSQVSSLRLLSRSGLDAYKEDVGRAVRDLGIRHLVDGSVRVDGKRVRVSAELVDASTQQTLWSDQYDRDLADVLTVQSQIAQQITVALHANLSPAEQRRIEKRPTDNIEAYTLFLQAPPAAASDRARNLQAIDQMRKALALDPQFALARSHLAYRLMFLATYEGPAHLDEALAEAEAAVRLDPSLPHAHFALASIYSSKGLGPQARQAFLRALELDPNNTSAMANLSIEELRQGRLDEAAYWGRRTFLRSGKRPNDFYHLIAPLMNLRADAESRVLLEEAERRGSIAPRIQQMLSLLELFEGHPDRAVARADALIARQPQNEEVKFYRADLAYLLDAPDLERWLEPLMERSASNSAWVAVSTRVKYAFALRKRGDTVRAEGLIAEADRIARKELGTGNTSPVLRVELAAVAALQKDANAAVESLQRAYEGQYRDSDFLDWDPILRSQLGHDPRFQEMIDRMRRDVAAQRERARTRGLLDLASLITPQ